MEEGELTESNSGTSEKPEKLMNNSKIYVVKNSQDEAYLVLVSNTKISIYTSKDDYKNLH